MDDPKKTALKALAKQVGQQLEGSLDKALEADDVRRLIELGRSLEYFDDMLKRYVETLHLDRRQKPLPFDSGKD